MSIFQTDDQSANGNRTTVTANDLVGDGKKYKSVDALAASRLEADRHIEKLEREQRELREELTKALAQKDATQQQSSVVEPPANQQEQAPTRQTPSDIASEVEKVLQKREYERAATSNIELVTNKLIEVYGDETKAAEVIKTKSKELDMSVAELQKLATDKPKAFFQLIGLDGKVKADTPKTNSHQGTKNGAAMRQVSSEAVVKPGTYSWYQELRRTSPGTFFSPRIQNQMDKDAREKGAAFYS